MAKLELASVVVFFFCFLSLSSSEIPKLPEVTPGDTPHADLIGLPSSSSNSQLTIFPESDSKSESSSQPIPVDLTDLKEETDDLPNSSPFKLVSFHHHHHDKDSDEDGGLRKSHHHHDDDESESESESESDDNSDDESESDDDSDDDSDDEDEEEKREKGGLLFKLRKFLDVF